MSYQVNYIVQSNVAWSDISVLSFDEAKTLAKDAVENGVADRTEIRDEANRVCFHFPRMMRRA